MTGNDLRQLYLQFFKDKKHILIPSASLVPVDDPTTLYTSSGMQPLVPYLLGEKHPLGKRLVNSQICFRAEDIEEIGDNRHTTFFEMLGNWSLGDYFKEKQLTWFFEFLTEILKLPKEKLAVTISAGGLSIPKDQESKKIWQSLGIKEDRIFTYPIHQENWWSRAGAPDKMPPGEIGGPDSEVFFEFTQVKHNPKYGKKCHPNCDCGRFLEIGNSVFMEYKKEKDGGFSRLPCKNVDFGGGLERILAAKLNTPDIFKTDLFWPVIQEIEERVGKKYLGNEKEMRVIADHLKAATFMINEGIEPDNKLQGYILRRLLRRVAVKARQLNEAQELKSDLTSVFDSICGQVIKIYQSQYFKAKEGLKKRVNNVISQEINKFSQSLDRGLKEYKKASGKELNELFAFNLFQTHGFPFEITQELFAKRGKKIDKKEFENIYKGHQQLSRTASKGMFKGGLADHSEKTTALHTATHLLHAALRKVLGDQVKQVGSNITEKRLRFDFIHFKKLSEGEIKKIEALVNQEIGKNHKLGVEEMALEEALKKGAVAFSGQQYPKRVKVYRVGDFSLELCGGPHVSFTGSLGEFRIDKEGSSGAGKRRIYASLV
ncbi:alanine--tRNA ligase [Candidatus Beckwithbacteria bacterium CG10_big_fil_rev_8_21_14_0_10_34_10]|uniref:alanine--tRNA ligase n=1 Tax=Candidatus Beckwithbacteria bacterium CG10_big_fil_rev_8_21_14_0_10_34_10 TaxID=1974495 RepID=A0A2H0W8W9_9BACT|nr:MAG: alanine--tRNA ligase [Candidatus Beckwithbacteria bacterium CG10_big_fil_rev_8_21_14_0_10_34_10]